MSPSGMNVLHALPRIGIFFKKWDYWKLSKKKVGTESDWSLAFCLTGQLYFSSAFPKDLV